MNDHEAYVAFNMVPDIGSVKVSALAGRHGGVAAAWEAFEDKTDWKGDAVDWKGELSRAEKMHVTILTCDDVRYPKALDALPSKPLALYVVGNPDALSKPGVAVVGTRLPTLYGTDMAERFSIGIANSGLSVISGLATGIDAAAHKGALSAGGVTVGVLGGALDRFFPEDNRELGRRIAASGGAVVCEYPFGFPPGRRTFPQRNRIVAALSRGVLAVEAPLQSGTLITCGFAKTLGRKVMAIPANLDSRSSAGCWKLIREGAAMVTSPEEVVKAVGASVKRRDAVMAVDVTSVEVERRTKVGKPSGECRNVGNGGDFAECESGHKDKSADRRSLTIEEAVTLKAIPSTGITLDRLAFVTKLPASAIGQATMSLRLKRLVRFLPGNRIAPEK